MNLLSSSEPVLAFLIACAAKVTVLFILVWIIVIALRDQSAVAFTRHDYAAIGDRTHDE